MGGRQSLQAATTPEEQRVPATIAGRYQLTGEVLGKGSFATVKLGYDIETKQKVAIRIANTATLDAVSLGHLRRGAELHTLLHHPNIVKVLWCKDDHELQTITMVQEFVPDGCLVDYYTKNGPLSEIQVRKIILQVIQAVRYMHRVGFVHRDIKAENVLIDAATFTAKLGDFGFADRFKQDTLFVDYPGTVAYSPPEVLKGKPYRGPPRDAWSIGVLVYVLLSGKYPFGSQSNSQTKNRVLRDEPDCSVLSPAAKHLTLRLLEKRSNHRISLADAIGHPWFMEVPALCPSPTSGLPFALPNTASPKSIALPFRCWYSSIRPSATTPVPPPLTPPWPAHIVEPSSSHSSLNEQEVGVA